MRRLSLESQSNTLKINADNSGTFYRVPAFEALAIWGPFNACLWHKDDGSATKLNHEKLFIQVAPQYWICLWCILVSRTRQFRCLSCLPSVQQAPQRMIVNLGIVASVTRFFFEIYLQNILKSSLSVVTICWAKNWPKMWYLHEFVSFLLHRECDDLKKEKVVSRHPGFIVCALWFKSPQNDDHICKSGTDCWPND